MLVIASCQQQLTSEPPPSSPDIESLTYTNSEYGFSLEYPKDWDFEEGFFESIVIFIRPLLEETPDMASINIGSAEFSEFPKPTLEEYVERSQLQIEESTENYNEVDRYNTTIGGQPAIVLTITGTRGNVYAMASQAYFFKENAVYIIIYTTSPESYDEYTDCFELVLSTFDFD